jgi:hypothetical protein
VRHSVHAGEDLVEWLPSSEQRGEIGSAPDRFDDQTVTVFADNCLVGIQL